MNEPALTTRERQVLALRVDYYGRKEIVAKLGLSYTVVDSDLASARKKFNARSSGEMLRRARLMGITTVSIFADSSRPTFPSTGVSVPAPSPNSLGGGAGFSSERG
jgi:DNA-binding CsgD family transcriptional regulator